MEIKKIQYAPQGVCSRVIDIEICERKIVKVSFTGGCSGNTSGIGALVEGMNVEQVVDRLRGIDCKGRGTSCPDQLAKALSEMI